LVAFCGGLEISVFLDFPHLSVLDCADLYTALRFAKLAKCVFWTEPIEPRENRMLSAQLAAPGS
jgi:hypothetical protein